MRYAVPASAGLHVALIVGAYLMMGLAPEAIIDEAGQAISVDIISLEASTSTTPSEIDSAATETLSVAGAETVPPVTREMQEADRPNEAEPVRAAPVETATADIDTVMPETAQPLAEPVEPTEPVEAMEPVETAVATAPSEAMAPVAAESEAVSAEILRAAPQAAPTAIAAPISQVADLSAPAFLDAPVPAATTTGTTATPTLTPQAAEAVRPVATALLAPALIEDLPVAPMPRPRAERPDPPPPPPRQPPAEAPPKQQAARPAPPERAGRSGNSDSEAQAGRQSGSRGESRSQGTAEVSRYEGQVQRAVARALRFPSGVRGGGTAQVRFVVSASGQVSNIAIIGSAGHAALDEAAVAAIRRAAPFPPIPAAAGRSSWTFAMPLTFNR